VLYTITDDLASYNLAVIAIDVVEHGSRATTDLTPWIPFLRIDALHCGRDNMRQTQVDLLNLSWAIRTALAEPDLFYWEEGGGFLQLDPERIFYIAESLGSILAPGYLALDDAVSGAVLFVGAGNLTEIVTRFEFIQPGAIGFNLIAFGLGFIRDYTIPELFYGTLGLGQEVLDKADPLTYAPFVIKADLPGSHRPKDVLFIQVIKDQTLANVTNEHLSRALGLDLVAPAKHEIPGIRVVAPPLRGNGPRGCTTGLIQFDEITVDGEKVKAEHNNILEGHEPVQATCVFLRTLADTGRATVEDTRFPYSSHTLSGSTYRNGLPD